MMQRIRNWVGQTSQLESSGREPSSTPDHDNADACIDTLDSVLRNFGEHDIPLDDGDPRFRDLCKNYARHITHGIGIDDEGISPVADGQRQWARVRQFFEKRRKRESEFVRERIRNYRIVVEDMTACLRTISGNESETASAVSESLTALETAADNGNVGELRQAVRTALGEVSLAFKRQEQHFNAQLKHANTQMQALKTDLLGPAEAPDRDALTDAVTRTVFDDALNHLITMNFVFRQPAVVALFRVESIDDINSRFGNGAGDDVLRGAADCLARSFVRRTDIIARFSGDTFGILLIDIEPSRATQLIEQVQTLLANSVSIPYAGPAEYVASRAGLTALRGTDTAESVLVRTRAALNSAQPLQRDIS